MYDFNDVLSSVTKWWEDEEQMSILKKFGIINHTQEDYINQAITIIQEIYPDRWDIQLSFDISRGRRPAFNPVVKFIIHFPEITMKNSRKEEHVIHDMYVSFEIIKYNDFIIGTIAGLRTTFSYDEYQAEYSHSHLTHINFKNKLEYHNFCTGTGVINGISMMFNSSLPEFDANLFKMYLFQIERFVSWESIEGGPYHYMSRVRVRGENKNLPVLDSGDIVKIQLLVLTRTKRGLIDLSKLNIDLDTDNNIFINDNETLDEFVLSIIGEHSNYRFYCSKDNEGNYVANEPLSDVESKLDMISDEPIYFKGEPKRLSVDVKLPVKEPKLIPHPVVKNVIKLFLEYEFNKDQIKALAFG